VNQRAKGWPHFASVIAAFALAPLVLCGLAGTARAEPADSGGIRAAFALSALKADTAKAAVGRDAAFAFTLTVGKNNAPLRGAKPAAWLVPHAAGSTFDERQCRQVAASFVRGASLAVPAVDLNTFYILVLGGDASVSVIDPRLGFGGSRLIGLATLDATATDWALTSDQAVLAVAQPSADQIALLDTGDWGVRSRIAVPGAARLALTPDGRQLVASYRVMSDGKEAESGVAVVDLSAAAEAPSRVATGTGPHEIAVDAEGRFAFVTNAGAGTVSVIDLATKQIVRSVRTGHRPTVLTYSALARRAYAAAEDGSLAVVGAAPTAPSATIAGPPGIVALRTTPNGRFLLAASAEAGRVIVIDTATDRIVQSIALAGQPDAIEFSDRVVYVRSRASEFVEAFPLDQIGIEGRTPSEIRVGVGQLALGATVAPSAADVMSPVPGGDGVVIVNAGDRAIYYYREGMAAPSGSFSTYGREPRGVKILDRRLREAEPGVYRTTGRLPRAGTYDVVLYIDTPRIVQCFQAQIEPDAAGDEGTAAIPLVTDLKLSGTPRAGEPLALHFRLLDPQTGMPMSAVQDARVVSFAIPGQSAARSAARALGDGAYEAEVSVPLPGNYYVFVEAPSVALAPAAGRVVAVAPAVAP
jgi:YVTN family beta-propeller protein